jgi:hypothetical protein
MKRVVFAAIVAFVIISLGTPKLHPRYFARDFNAFYCAGKVVRSHADPYRAEPLGACERAPKQAPFYTVPSGVALPAPLPPYDLLAFSWLALLPYELAGTLWLLAIVAALVVTIEAMHRITQLPRSLLWLVFGPIDGWSAVLLGEVAPLAVASLALAMLALREGRPRLAAGLVVVSLCEPHVGIAPLLALFVCVPRTRIPLVFASLALAAISFASVGTVTAFQYAHEVLPAHAFSEIESTRQLSLTAVLHSLGFSNATALSLGSISYALMLLAGVATAKRLSGRDPSDVLIIAAPAAFVLVGGVFIHAIQMPAALPAALVAYTRVEGRLKSIIGVAIVGIAVPWMSFLAFGIELPYIAFLTGLLSFRLLNLSPRVAIAVGLAAACFVFGLEFAMASGPPYPPAGPLPPIVPHDLAEVSWGQNVRAISAIDRSIFNLARVPTWLAVSLLALALSSVSRAQPSYRFERATIGLRVRAPIP